MHDEPQDRALAQRYQELVSRARREFGQDRHELKKKRRDVILEIDLAERTSRWRYSADALKLKDGLGVIDHLLGAERSWHPESSIRVEVLGAMDDYVEVFRFPCCDRTVVSEGPPSQLTSGCEDVR